MNNTDKINIHKCNANINGQEYYNKNLNRDNLINFSLILCITLFLIFLFITINTININNIIIIIFTYYKRLLFIL